MGRLRAQKAHDDLSVGIARFNSNQWMTRNLRRGYSASRRQRMLFRHDAKEFPLRQRFEGYRGMLQT